MTRTEHYQNPFHAQGAQQGEQITLQQGIEHDLGQLISLELTAESMFQ